MNRSSDKLNRGNGKQHKKRRNSVHAGSIKQHQVPHERGRRKSHGDLAYSEPKNEKKKKKPKR